MPPEAGEVPLTVPGTRARKTWRQASIGRRTSRSKGSGTNSFTVVSLPMRQHAADRDDHLTGLRDPEEAGVDEHSCRLCQYRRNRAISRIADQCRL